MSGLQGSGFRAQQSRAQRFAIFYGEEDADAGSPWPNPQTRLSEFFERWFVPHYAPGREQRRRQRTLAETRSWVRRFVDLIEDLPLGAVTTEQCERFAASALLLPRDLYIGPSYAAQRAARWPAAPAAIRRHRRWRPAAENLSPRTVRKGCVALQAVLDAAGPRSRNHKRTAEAEGLFGLDAHGAPVPAPWFPDVEAEPAGWVQKVFTVEEIAQILRACLYARRPRLPGLAAADWWRALLKFLYNTGLRIGTALALRRSMLGRNLFGESFLAIPSRADKKGKPRIVVLSSHALAAIAALPSTTELIFPQPHGSQQHLLRLLHQLEAAAGLPPERRFGFHALRRANITQMWYLDPAAAQDNAGHADPRTTINHYVAAEAQVRAKAAKDLPALERLPQPAE